MPLKLVPPRAGKSPNWTIRGSYLGQRVDQTSGTHRRPVALEQLKKIQRKIEAGEYRREAFSDPVEKTFAMSALTYLETGGDATYIPALVKYFGHLPLVEIGQDAIDEAATALKPHTTGATRNRHIYTPARAVLASAGIDIKLRRPKDSKGRVIRDALKPDDAFAIIAAAETFDQEYADLLKFLLYTGVRIGEALALRWDDVRLDERRATVRLTKNGDPRELTLRDDVCEALRAAKLRANQERVFRFHQGGWLKLQLLRCKLMACGLPMIDRPKKGQKQRVPAHRLSWVNHHTFRHTFATWMRRYGGLDQIGLMATGNWRDPRSAARYAHAASREEWAKVADLPTAGGKLVEKAKGSK